MFSALSICCLMFLAISPQVACYCVVATSAERMIPLRERSRCKISAKSKGKHTEGGYLDVIYLRYFRLTSYPDWLAFGFGCSPGVWAAGASEPEPPGGDPKNVGKLGGPMSTPARKILERLCPKRVARCNDIYRRRAQDAKSWLRIIRRAGQLFHHLPRHNCVLEEIRGYILWKKIRRKKAHGEGLEVMQHIDGRGSRQTRCLFQGDLEQERVYGHNIQEFPTVGE
ncbi:hypothetical protein C8J57DRAFT_1228149 [Mycena rebaudengoi]|nr:hypothetical protein C8J57DRAFT_1228149 [Mycena rebaudengoi]